MSESIKWVCLAFVAVVWISATHPRFLDSVDKVSTNLKKIDVHDVELVHIDCVGICLKN